MKYYKNRKSDLDGLRTAAVYLSLLGLVGGVIYLNSGSSVRNPISQKDSSRDGLDPYRAGSVEGEALIPKAGSWSFDTGAFCIPHPSKTYLQADPNNKYNLTSKGGGEDSYFFTNNVLGIADGVGGWAEMGISSALYSRMLMHLCQKHSLEEMSDSSLPDLNPTRLMKKGHESMPRMLTKTQPFFGSTTACLASLQNGILASANLGDSGYLLMRDNQVIFRARQGQHAFNFPFQLSAKNDEQADTADHALVQKMAVKPGDIIVMATDGMFDNLFNEDVANVIRKATAGGESVGRMAELVAKEAEKMAKMDDRASPFYLEAKQVMGPVQVRLVFPTKGKVDDICVLVAKVLLNGQDRILSKL